ncbi:hypothetical protein [Streptomyces sp. NBC_01334]|uniref:hypothetical protein n=1 Tax=Streptomyces sp. NBC_01334 TaxID=2903827 RepID=UPI002E13AD75|nr:hypothetical protein OG736_46490 [Streptomyces sp. NBC_01334]
MRHLTPAFALGALRRGRQIEQFLGATERDSRPGLRWIALGPGRKGVTVYLSEVEDVSTDSFLDVTEFPPLDPDDETWGRVLAVLPTPEEALELARCEFAADPQRWVNHGFVSDEYYDFWAERRANP